MSGSLDRKSCSIYWMASCLVLLADTAVTVPAGGRSVEVVGEISLSLTVAMSCRVGQLMRKRSSVAVHVGSVCLTMVVKMITSVKQVDHSCCPHIVSFADRGMLGEGARGLRRDAPTGGSWKKSPEKTM